MIAHEVGHHVQKLLGTSDQVHSAQQGLGKADANALSVKLELQADCFARITSYNVCYTKLLRGENPVKGVRAWLPRNLPVGGEA